MVRGRDTRRTDVGQTGVRLIQGERNDMRRRTDMEGKNGNKQLQCGAVYEKLYRR